MMLDVEALNDIAMDIALGHKTVSDDPEVLEARRILEKEFAALPKGVRWEIPDDVPDAKVLAQAAASLPPSLASRYVMERNETGQFVGSDGSGSDASLRAPTHDDYTPEGAKAYLMDVAGVKSVGLTKVDERLLVPIVQEVHRMLTEFPELRGRLTEVMTIRGGDVKQRANQLASMTSTGTMYLRAEFWGNLQKFTKVLDDGVKTGFHPVGCDTPASVITHELGHLYDAVHGGVDRSDAGPRNVLGEINLTDYASAGRASPVASIYAKTSPAERWAESFASVYHTPKDQWTSDAKMAAQIIEYYKKPEASK